MEISLPPESARASVDFPRVITLGTTKTSRTMEDSLSWSMQTTVPLQAYERVSAVMKVIEQEHHKDFVMSSTMSGKLLVMVMDRNRDLIQTIEGQVSAIMQHAAESGLRINQQEWSIHGNEVTFTTSGTTYFRYGVTTEEVTESV